MTAALYGQVERVERLAPRMVRVVLGGDGLAGFESQPFTDQYVNALFVPEGAPYTVPFDLTAARAGAPRTRPVGRRYTVRAWDPGARLLSIDFVVHGDHGVAGRWAQAARIGDRLQMTGPSGAYAPSPTADWHLMVGDESALPAIAASLEQVPTGVAAIALLLVDGPGHELALHCPGDLQARWLHRETGPPGVDLLLQAVEGLDFPDGSVHGFVHGEAGETRAVRRHLLGDRGVPREQLSISPYWRRDFSDERWREVKADWLAEQERDLG